MDPTSSTRPQSRSQAATETRRSTFTRLVAASVITFCAVAINLLQACGFTAQEIETPQDVYDILDEAILVEPTAEDRWTVINDDKLRVEHGYACAEAPNAASEEYIGLRVVGFTRMPPNFDGTVFLNGWHLEYASGDHNVVGLGTSIFNIVQLNDTLVWHAGGVISDNDGDEAYRWCYDYTTVAWARPISGRPGTIPTLQPHIEMQATHSDQQARLMYVNEPSGNGMQTIRGSYKSAGGKPRGVLLAGFGLSHTDDDHDVLQIGFDLGKAKIKNKRIRWKADAVLKDNSKRDPRAAQIVSVLTGESVNIYHPPGAFVEGGDAGPGGTFNQLKLTPRGKESSCDSRGAARTYEMAIITPPYTWAIPMLTGWDLGDPCEDNNLTHVGAEIQDFHYVYVPGDANGTIYYTMRTNYGDKNDSPGMLDRVQVDVLGINLLQPVANGGTFSSAGSAGVGDGAAE